MELSDFEQLARMCVKAGDVPIRVCTYLIRHSPMSAVID